MNITRFKMRNTLMGLALGALMVPAIASATEPTAQFDFGTEVTAMQTQLIADVTGNIGPVLLLFGVFVGIAIFWKMLRKAGARTR